LKLLIIKGVGSNIDVALLQQHIKEPITQNSYPTTPSGIAIIAGNNEPNWEWPDEVIKVGTAETSRHHVDATLDPNTDVESQILDLWESASGEESPEDMIGT